MSLPRVDALIRHWHVHNGLFKGGVRPALGDQISRWTDRVVGDAVSQLAEQHQPRLVADGLKFESNHSLSNDNSVDLGTGARTVVALVKVATDADGGTIANLNRPGDHTNEYALNADPLDASNNTAGYTAFGEPLSPDTFQIVAISNPDLAAASNLKAYLDGVLLTPAYSNSGAYDTTGAYGFVIGDYGAGDYYFEGTIKALAIWDAQLSDAEVAGLTSSDLVPGDPNYAGTPIRFELLDRYGQTLDLGLLHPNTMVPGGQVSAEMYRAYGSRDWVVAGDRLPSPEPWVWQGKIQRQSYPELTSYLASLETFARNAVRVTRSSDGAWVPLSGGGRPLGPLLNPTSASVTIALFPTTDSWLVDEARVFDEGYFGESVFPDETGIRRSY